MSSAALQAHLRLLQALADRVTTHLMDLHRVNSVGHSYGRDVPQYLVDEVMRMRAEGVTQREVISRLHIGSKTYVRILQIIKAKK